MPIEYKEHAPAPAKKKRAPGKPRKRLTQVKANQDPNPVLYHWHQFLDSYVFTPADNVSANLTERDGKWTMVVVIDGKKFVGERPTLEEAFKATDALLFKHAKDYWLKSICSEVLKPWVSTL